MNTHGNNPVSTPNQLKVYKFTRLSQEQTPSLATYNYVYKCTTEHNQIKMRNINKYYYYYYYNMAWIRVKLSRMNIVK